MMMMIKQFSFILLGIMTCGTKDVDVFLLCFFHCCANSPLSASRLSDERSKISLLMLVYISVKISENTFFIDFVQ